LEEDLKKLLEDSKQETFMNGKTTLSNCIRIAEPILRKKKSRTSFKKTTHKKKQSKNTFSNIDDIDDKIEHCLQKAKDILSINATLGESSTQWTLNSAELEQDQAFIKYLEQLDEPVPEDELAIGHMTLTCSWKDYAIPTRLKLSGSSPKQKTSGTIHKASHQLNWTNTCLNSALKKTLFQSKIT